MSVKVIEIMTAPPSLDEVLRYMKAGQMPDKDITSAANMAIERICTATRARACYKELPVELLGGGEIRLGSLRLESTNLESRLSGCSSAYVFAATVGSEVDRIIRAESTRSSLSGLCADAAGSAAIECACDEVNEQIRVACEREGKHTKTRFSAGYGDLSIEYQKDICSLLETKKNIGVALGEGGMMNPQKSVTAIIGVY